jgi:quercetin dioxygenase-like cupin family protein
MKYVESFKTKQGIKPIEGITVKSVHLDNVMMTYMEFEPNTDIPEHAHPHEQITMIHRGRLEMTVDTQTTIMQPGDVVKVPPNITHSARTLEEPTIAVDAWSPIREDYK